MALSGEPPEYGNIDSYLEAMDRLLDNGAEFIEGLDFENIQGFDNREEYTSLLERGRTSKAVATLRNGQEEIELAYNEI